MPLKLTLVFLALSLMAQDAGPQTPVKTMEQQLAEAKQEIALQKAKVQIYEQALATCQDAHIDAQARRQAAQSAIQATAQTLGTPAAKEPEKK